LPSIFWQSQRKGNVVGGIMTNFKLLDPKMDFIFKLIFGNEKHPKILISFLNAVIQPRNKIVSVKIKNVDLEKKHLEDKFSRLDVFATTSNDEIVNIEIQLKDEKNMIKRSLYYLSKMYESQLGSGENYKTLPRTVAINILRFEYLEKEKNFHNAYRFKNIKNNNELTDVMEIHFIELPKFDEKKEGKLLVENLKKLDMLKAWTLFLKEPNSQNVRTLEDSVKEIKEAKEELTIISSDEKNRDLYEMREASLHDRVSALEGAEEKGYQKAQKEIEKALKREKDAIKREKDAQKEKEITLRREEKLLNDKKEAVCNLLNMGLSKEKVAEAMKLSVSEIEKIQESSK
jgi:predicted transposase/invertase (TIGR01784 family)